MNHATLSVLSAPLLPMATVKLVSLTPLSLLQRAPVTQASSSIPLVACLVIPFVMSALQQAAPIALPVLRVLSQLIQLLSALLLVLLAATNLQESAISATQPALSAARSTLTTVLPVLLATLTGQPVLPATQLTVSLPVQSLPLLLALLVKVAHPL